MSQENVEIVRRIFDAEARRDAATALSLYDPEIEFDTSRGTFGDLMGRRLYHGHDGLRRWFREWYEAWEHVEEDIEELIDAGDDVISLVTMRGRGRASGIELELPRQPAVWTIREGKIVRVVWFRTRDEALDAAGSGE
jgi:ketosteroid isomerase-like protein